MILHPGVFALLVGSGIALLVLSAAALLGIKVRFSWNIADNSELQLSLERKTYLVSTLVAYGLGFEILSSFLFVYVADDLNPLLVGAMCATGTLNASPYGFPALLLKIASLFMSSAWIILHHLDIRAEDYPLTRAKYALLLYIAPCTLASFILMFLHFRSLDPAVITSCCGMLFSETGTGAGSSLASLHPLGMRTAFFTLFAILLFSGIAGLKTGRPWLYASFSLLSLFFFLVSLLSVISFISLYFYQLPTHHCPFDILKAEYYYAGYPLYIFLFAGTVFGMMTGVAHFFAYVPSLKSVLPSARRRWTIAALFSFTAFVIICAAPMVFLSFTLRGY